MPRFRGHVLDGSYPAGHCGSAGVTELAGELLAEVGDLGAQPCDLFPVGVQLLAERVGAGSLAGWDAGRVSGPGPAELTGGLEVQAGQACVGVRAVLRRRAAAVAVGQGVGGPGEPVLDPLGVRGGRAGVEAEQLALDVHRLWQ